MTYTQGSPLLHWLNAGDFLWHRNKFWHYLPAQLFHEQCERNKEYGIRDNLITLLEHFICSGCMRNKLFDIAVLPNENKNKGLIGDWAFANFECVLHTRPPLCVAWDGKFTRWRRHPKIVAFISAVLKFYDLVGRYGLSDLCFRKPFVSFIEENKKIIWNQEKPQPLTIVVDMLDISHF